MPLEQGLGLEQEDDLTEPGASPIRPGRQFPSEDDQRELVPAGNARCTRLVPLEDAQLLPQEEDFQVFLVL